MKFLTVTCYATYSPLVTIFGDLDSACNRCERHGQDDSYLSPYKSVLFLLDHDYADELATYLPMVGWVDRAGQKLDGRPIYVEPEVLELDDEIPF